MYVIILYRAVVMLSMWRGQLDSDLEWGQFQIIDSAVHNITVIIIVHVQNATVCVHLR